jgi:hypothetical protein
MQINLKKEKLIAWSVLGGVTVIGMIALYAMSGDGETALALEQARAVHAEHTGRQKIQDRIAEQRRANERLKKTIEDLKVQVGFHPKLNIPERTQHNFFFSQARSAVRDRIKKKAEVLSIGDSEKDYDTYLGFGKGPYAEWDAKLPPEDKADILLAMLQLTEKAALIATGDSNDPLDKLIIKHDEKPIETKPQGKDSAALMREYSITVEVKGSLTTILEILHKFSIKDSGLKSVIDPQINMDYPLVLTQLTINSANAKAKDGIQQLDATFKLAGMEFLSEAERTAAPGTGQPTERRAGEGRVRR